VIRFARSTLDNQRAGHADSALVDVHKPDASSYSNPRSRLKACSSPLSCWRTQFLIYSRDATGLTDSVVSRDARRLAATIPQAAREAADQPEVASFAVRQLL